MTPGALEAHVHELLHSGLERYRQMNTLADQMLDGDATSQHWHQSAERLNQMIQSLDIEGPLNRFLQQESHQRQIEPGGAISALKEKLALQMQSFLMKISRLEQTALKSKQSLLPQIQSSVRAMQMKNAYGKYS
jgi:hypothetical protein